MVWIESVFICFWPQKHTLWPFDEKNRHPLSLMMKIDLFFWNWGFFCAKMVYVYVRSLHLMCFLTVNLLLPFDCLIKSNSFIWSSLFVDICFSKNSNTLVSLDPVAQMCFKEASNASWCQIRSPNPFFFSTRGFQM